MKNNVVKYENGGSMKKKFYAYFLEKSNLSGICDTWEECQKKIKGNKSRYKSFSTLEEAKMWLKEGANYENKTEIKKERQKTLPEGVYFDAGTGRKIGVEVRVTDVKGNSLLHLSEYSKFVNEFGNINLGFDRTNNYGELLGLFLAIEIANKINIDNIYGDSKLILQYWSKGFYHSDKLTEKTVSLILKTISARRNFEKNNGSIEYISGDYNPADLGFHK